MEVVKVDHLELSISKCDVEGDVTRVVRHVRPHWDVSQLKFKQFTDGITNRLIGVYLESDRDDMLLIRVYGDNTELYIDRKVELRNIKLLSKAGLVPPLYCTFKNGICYGYSPGEVLDERMVREPHICRNISVMMARMHTLRPFCSDNNSDMIAEPEPMLFKGFRKFLGLIPSSLDDSYQQKRLRKYVPKIESLTSEVELLENRLKKLCSPVVFCHNDLLLKNIVYNSKSKSVTFIDFEYADYNYQAFDIANHFCEFAGVDTFDASLYPDKEFQMRWLRNYIEVWFAIRGDNCVKNSKNVSIEEAVNTLYNQVNEFSLSAHLFWGLWALIQAKHSSIDFDFLGYAIQRLQEYFRRRKQVIHTNGFVTHK